MQSNIQKYTNSYQNLVNNLVTSLHTDLQNIIGNQLISLSHQPILSTKFSSMKFSPDQYKVYNIITNSWEQKEFSKHPYFFLTG